jgi:hypothetical protein
VDTTITYTAGLDLGQSHEFTALAVVEKEQADDERGQRLPAKYAVRHLERFPIGTPYGDIFGRVVALFGRPPLSGAEIGVDQTGVGEPVIKALRRMPDRLRIKPVTITAGLGATWDGIHGWLVPKLDLVGLLQLLLQEKRLKVAEALEEAETLMDELTNFQVHPVRSVLDPLTAWREGQHDDMVFAVGIAVWLAERYVPFRLEWIGDPLPGPRLTSSWRPGPW